MSNISNDDGLPPSIAELCLQLGDAATLALVKVYGGRLLYVPVGPLVGLVESDTKGCELIEVVGRAAAEKLIEIYGGDTLYVPKCQTAIQRARWRKIQNDFDQGIDPDKLAVKYSLSIRQIFYVLKKVDISAPKLSAQGELF